METQPQTLDLAAIKEQVVRRTHVLRYRSAGHFVEHYRS